MKKKLFNPFENFKGKIFILSPARAPKKEKLNNVINIFRKLNIEFEYSNRLFDNLKSSLPANPEFRAKEFNHALKDNKISMLLCARGGFGSSDILPLINWNLLKEKKKIVMGFSDISAIHLAMLKKNAGIPISGPMLSDLPQAFENNFAGISLKKALDFDSSPLEISQFCEIRSYNEGKAKGKICVSNLTVICSLIGTPFMPTLKNKILLIEDINEPYHQIYRCLSQLELSGITKKISALLIGNFKNCGKEKDLNEVFANFAKKHKYPILSGIPFGHIKKIMSFRLNSTLIVDGKNITII